MIFLEIHYDIGQASWILVYSESVVVERKRRAIKVNQAAVLSDLGVPDMTPPSFAKMIPAMHQL